MTSQDFRNEIEIKKPRYLSKYASLIDTISTRGSINGGNYIQFGAFYQTYMYAFMLGYKIGECNPISGEGEQKDFAAITNWKPNDMVDYILMLTFSEPEEKLGFKWIDLDTMDDENAKKAALSIVRIIEGYANTGLNYIQQKFDNHKDEFTDPFVFVNMLREVSDK